MIIAPERSRRVRLVWFVPAVIVFVVWFVGFVRFVDSVPRMVEDARTPTDVIVVLTGGSERLTEGLALLEAGLAERLFVSGVYRGVDVAEILQLQKHGPGHLMDRIVLGHVAADTRGNALETAEWMRAQGLDSLRLVTGNYHMPRSMAEFRRALPEAVLIDHPVVPRNVHLDPWWRWPGTARLLALEYSKYLFARLRLHLESLSRRFTHR